MCVVQPPFCKLPKFACPSLRLLNPSELLYKPLHPRKGPSKFFKPKSHRLEGISGLQRKTERSLRSVSSSLAPKSSRSRVSDKFAGEWRGKSGIRSSFRRRHGKILIPSKMIANLRVHCVIAKRILTPAHKRSARKVFWQRVTEQIWRFRP